MAFIVSCWSYFIIQSIEMRFRTEYECVRARNEARFYESTSLRLEFVLKSLPRLASIDDLKSCLASSKIRFVSGSDSYQLLR